MSSPDCQTSSPSVPRAARSGSASAAALVGKLSWVTAMLLLGLE
jgi:hypothetical protein